MQNEEITGIILAGGQGSRMGGKDKGWIMYRNKPMITQVIERLTPQVEDIIISANRNLDDYKRFGFTVVADTDADITTSFEGPVAGILRCLSQIETEYAVVVPCDAPLIGVNLVETLWTEARSTNKPLVLFEVENRIQPLFGLYHRSLVDSLQRYFDQGERKLVRWCKQQAPRLIQFEGETQEFANINTPEELESIQKP